MHKLYSSHLINSPWPLLPRPNIDMTSDVRRASSKKMDSHFEVTVAFCMLQRDMDDDSEDKSVTSNNVKGANKENNHRESLISGISQAQIRLADRCGV